MCSRGVLRATTYLLSKDRHFVLTQAKRNRSGRSGLDRTNVPVNLIFFHFLTGARQPSWSGLARVKTAASLIRPRQVAQTESTLQKNGVNNSYLNKEKGK